MLLEINRFLFLVFPYVLCTTLAAFILWAEDVKKQLPRFAIYIITAAFAQTLTYQIHHEAARFIVEVIAGFIIAKIVFNKTFLWTFKIYASSYLIGYITSLGSIFYLLLYTDNSVYQISTDKKIWLSIILPMNLLGVLLAWLFRRAWPAGRNFLIRLKEIALASPAILIALFLQTVLFIALTGQILFKYGSSSKYEYVLLVICLIALYALSIYVLLKYMTISKDEVKVTQDTVSENIMEMINTVRGQRHDFMNHLQVIDGLNRLGNSSELDDYLAELLNETSNYNEMLKINNPIIAALINAKISQANMREIILYTHIESTLSCLSTAAVDVTRIIGNLIDNAMDAAEEANEKWIRIDITEKESQIFCAITNPFKGNPEILNNIFKPGVTSKSEHDGLGLYVCQKLCNKIHGNLELSWEAENEVTFTVMIPQA